MTTITLGCNDCGATFTATAKGQRETRVRHTRDEIVMRTEVQTDELSAAVQQHRARGCPARHFREVVTEGEG